MMRHGKSAALHPLGDATNYPWQKVNRRASLKHPAPMVIAWETTRKCLLNCRHCRGSACNKDYEDELTTEECMAVIDSIASFSKPLLILSGGEPMLRDDIYDLAAYANSANLPVVLATCGHLLTPETVELSKKAGILAISASIDGADAETHDAFRGVPGSFDRVVTGLQYARAANFPFQINTTVTRHNINQLEGVFAIAEHLGAMTADLFFLVPTGRGLNLEDEEISPQEYEETLRWLHEKSGEMKIGLRISCSPHFSRVKAEIARKTDKPNYGSSGCMAGHGIIFVSHCGIVQPCGFLDLSCGGLAEYNFDLRKIYNESKVLSALRDRDQYTGKCKICAYWTICGGCRARAFYQSRDYLNTDKACIYEPENTLGRLPPL